MFYCVCAWFVRCVYVEALQSQSEAHTASGSFFFPLTNVNYYHFLAISRRYVYCSLFNNIWKYSPAIRSVTVNY